MIESWSLWIATDPIQECDLVMTSQAASRWHQFVTACMHHGELWGHCELRIISCEFHVYKVTAISHQLAKTCDVSVS